MIPKIIHYCWLSSDPFPSKIQSCIDSWYLMLPGYQIKLWNLQNTEINQSKWVLDAFNSKKYAFAADYIRLYALYHYGGIYLDSDVEVRKSFDNLLDLPYFMGVDSQNKIEAAVIGTEPHNQWIFECLKYYDSKDFVMQDGHLNTKTLPLIMEQQIKSKWHISLLSKKEDFLFSQNTIQLFPFDYFCSKRHDDGTIKVTSHTYTIHHFAMSWCSPKNKFLTRCKRVFFSLFGERITKCFVEYFHLQKLK